MVAGDGKGASGPGDSVLSVTSRRTGSSVLIEVEGEVDVASAPHLSDSLVRAINRHDGAQIRLDLSRVSFMDGAGWRPVAVAGEALEDRGESLVIVAMSPQVRLLVDVLARAAGLGGGVSLRLDPQSVSGDRE